MPKKEKETNKTNQNLSNKKSSRKSMIHIRGAFSESIGIQTCITQMQYTEFDNRTRTLISNQLRSILEFFFEKCGKFGDAVQYKNSYGDNSGAEDFCCYVISEIFNERINLEKGYSYIWRVIFDRLHNVISKAPYNEVLDVVELSCGWINNHYCNHDDAMFLVMNEVFEKEYVGYRFVDSHIVAITDKNEIESIEIACKNPYQGCRGHIQKAVGFLADREKKDYKNCIKESISAVENICQVITANDKATLGQALKQLKDNGVKIHQALESAFTKLYGYTSDEGGIRHSERLFESNVTFEEAKFMLVSCSAFVNYLISELGKIEGKNNATNER